MATVTAVLLLYQFRSIAILVVMAVLVGAAVRPAIVFLVDERHMPRPAATLIVYFISTAFLLIFLLIPGSTFINEIQAMVDDFAATYEGRYPMWLEGTTIEQALASRLPPPDQFYQALVNPDVAQQVLGFTRGLFGLIGGIAIVLVLSIYWTIDQARLERYWISLLPANRRMQARKIWRATEISVGAYLRSEIAQSLAAVLLLFLAYRLLGLEYPLILAVLGAVAWLVPLVGVVLAVIPVLLIGLLNNTLGLSAVAGLCTIAILSGLELVVEPRLAVHRRYSPILTVFLMLVFVEDFGLLGLVMAPPLAATLQIIFDHWLEYNATTTSTRPVKEINELKTRLEKLLADQTQNGSPISPEITNLGHRLSGLIDDANKLVSK
jgi:predicted PurR-regulated permease PerM